MPRALKTQGNETVPKTACQTLAMDPEDFMILYSAETGGYVAEHKR